ncbi:Uncharacterized protein TCM_029523 [Theobroma cacao]|uniref:Uncharacterized protein n=1 Tax=Theobroma cacao TaxID=3641 RepID=A0A061GEC3_THECC|nr:Uncharacterized protein TCM_029523 [Theobroma cacao]
MHNTNALICADIFRDMRAHCHACMVLFLSPLFLLFEPVGSGVSGAPSRPFFISVFQLLPSFVLIGPTSWINVAKLDFLQHHFQLVMSFPPLYNLDNRVVVNGSRAKSYGN